MRYCPALAAKNDRIRLRPPFGKDQLTAAKKGVRRSRRSTPRSIILPLPRAGLDALHERVANWLGAAPEPVSKGTEDPFHDASRPGAGSNSPSTRDLVMFGSGHTRPQAHSHLGSDMVRADLQTHGAKKYPNSALLQSSAGLGWSGVSAELRSHEVSHTPIVVPVHFELTVAVSGNQDGVVRRTGGGLTQEVIPSTGTVWLTPPEVGDNEITITSAIPETFHIFLPTTQFGRLANDFNLPIAPAHSIRYLSGIDDEPIRQIALSIRAEMMNESAAGRMFVETASLTLAARLLQRYCDSGSCAPLNRSFAKLDHARLRRVLDYISAHLSDEITIEDLARVACLSPFHFARTFTSTIGASPQRYVSGMRMQNAMAKIASGRVPLIQVALDAGFSSQASFTRAFHRATGVTPGEYRRQRS